MTTAILDLTGRHAAGRPGLTRWPALRWELAARRRWSRLAGAVARAIPASFGSIEMAAWAGAVVVGAYGVVLAGILSRMPG